MDSLLASFSLTAIDCLLAAIFAAIAFTYAAVGLGGGSAYTALLVIANLPAASIPTIALTMNLIVTSAGGSQFVRGGHARPGLITPFLISSIPAAYLGGALQLSETLFQVLLLISLAALLPLLLLPKTQTRRPPSGTGTFVLTALVGGGFLGFLAGAAGIGGGIYLAPLIVVLGLGTVQQAAACGAIFIWTNSVAGLIARAQHHVVPWEQLTLFGSIVLVSGIVGSRLGARRLSASTLEKILSLVIAVAIVLLAHRLWTG